MPAKTPDQPSVAQPAHKKPPKRTNKLKAFRKITKRRPSRSAWFLIRNWGAPVLLTLAILVAVHAKVAADTAPTTTELQQYLQTNSLRPGFQPDGGYDQIYYTYKGQHISVTTEAYNHVEPSSSGAYIVWQGQINGAGQIFQYNVLTGEKVQLTNAGNNDQPFAHDNTVTWQCWDGSVWQICYYDGTGITKITNNTDSSYTPSTNGQQIIYAVQLGDDSWEARSYDISSGQTTVVADGDTSSTAYPHFNSDGSVSTAFTPY